MKNITYILSILLLSSFITLIGCKDDSDPAPTELDLQLTALQNGGSNWVLGVDGVLKDGFDVSNQFSGFKLTIGAFTFTTKNSLSGAWPASGTWEFQDDNPNQVLRSDGVLMAVNLSGDNLTLTFQGSATGGRINSVDGEYQFRLVSE